MRLVILSVLSILFGSAVHATDFTGNTDPDRVSYLLGVDEIETDLTLISTTVMPDAELRIRVDADAYADRGELQPGAGEWIWTAPDTPGPAMLRFERNGETRTLIVFVLTPFSNGRDTEIDNFRIGAYSPEPFRGLEAYRPPQGFIDTTLGSLDMPVSPNFTLGQFLCKQQPGHDPAFVLIRSALLSQLEGVLDLVQAEGHDVKTLTVMSGFRTPWYNASIGNVTTSSRHLFGGAADVFVDANEDGWMDDINSDGKVDVNDAKLLASWAETAASTLGEMQWPDGGLGIYSENSIRGPFVHIDARGYKARW